MNDYGWFYDLECPPDQAAVEYYRIHMNSLCSNRFAYQVRYNRLLIATAKPSNDEFLTTECVVPSDAPHIIEIPEPTAKGSPQPDFTSGIASMPIPIPTNTNKETETKLRTRLQVIGSVIAGMVCYGVMTA